MRVHVRLGEPFWRVVGQREVEVVLPAGSSLADLLAHLRQMYPDLETEMGAAPPLLFLDDDEADPETLLSEGDRVHLLWPIAGGMESTAPVPPFRIPH